MKTLLNIRSLCLALILSIYGQARSECATITEATSTGPAHMALITISGSGLSVKSPAPPRIWADFEGSANPSNLGQTTSWAEIKGLSFVSSDTMVGSYSGGMLKAQIVGCSGSVNHNFHVEHDLVVPGTNYFLMAHRKISHSPTSNQKMGRYWSAGITTPDFLWSRGDSGWACYTEGDGAGGTEGYHLRFQGSNYTNDTWHQERQEWTHGDNTTVTAITGDGTFRNYRDSTLVQVSTDMPNASKLQRLLFLEVDYAAGAACPADNSTIYVDNVYIDDNFFAVFASSANSNGTCPSITSTATLVAPQIPVTWSATEITAMTNFGSLDTANGLCISVRDNTRTFSNTVLLNAEGGGEPEASSTGKINATGQQKFQGQMRFQ